MSGKDSLENFFNPEKVVLLRSSAPMVEVGMSKPEVSGSVAENLLKGGKDVVEADLSGEGWRDELSCIGELSGALCVVATAGKALFSAMEMLIAKGVKDYIILPGDFSTDEKRKLKALIEERGIRVLGPNSIFGVIDTGTGMNTTFERGLELPAGGSSFIFQSGGVGAAVIDQVLSCRIGVRRLAFLGNRYSLKEGDLLKELVEDKGTFSIGIYTEGMNIRDVGLESLRELSRRKPITLLKGGKSEAGRRRAALHTDSLSKDEEVFSGVLRGLGCTVVDEVDLLALQTHFFSLNPGPPESDGVYIVSNVGGPAIELSDKLVARGIRVPRLPEGLAERWMRVLKQIEPVNPVDLIADATPERYMKALDLLLEGRAQQALIIITALKSTLLGPSDVAEIISRLEKRDLEGRAVLIYIPGEEDYRRVLEATGDLPFFTHHSSRIISDVLSNWHRRWRVLSQ